MGNSPVDRDENYMREMWGTNRLVSDYGSMERINVYEEKKEFLQEIMDYEKTHDLKSRLNCMRRFVMMRIMMTGSMVQSQIMEILGIEHK